MLNSKNVAGVKKGQYKSRRDPSVIKQTETAQGFNDEMKELQLCDMETN